MGSLHGYPRHSPRLVQDHLVPPWALAFQGGPRSSGTLQAALDTLHRGPPSRMKRRQTDKVGLRPRGRQGAYRHWVGQRLSPSIRGDSRNTGGAFCSTDSFIQLMIPGRHNTASSPPAIESTVSHLLMWKLATGINHVWLRWGLNPAVQHPSQALYLMITHVHCSNKEGMGVP